MSRGRFILTAVLLVDFCLTLHLHAEERFLLAADLQVIEINRAGRVTEQLKHAGHVGIYDAWRLPDGGIAYAHQGGLAVYDANKQLVLEHVARRGRKGVEANSCAVLDGGARFALMDSGVCQIRLLDRHGAVLNELALPDLQDDALHFRYRMVRAVPGENAFWVGQYGRKTVLKIDASTGKQVKTIPLEPLLKPSSAVQKAFAMVQPGDGSIFVSTSTGCQLLHVAPDGKALTCWTAKELGLSCQYLLGMQMLASGNLLIACGDYHIKSVEEGRDVLAEINPEGKVVWQLTRDQLVDHIDGYVDSHSHIKELHITNVHAYDSERVSECLKVKR